MTTDPAIDGAVLTEDDLPERLRDPYALKENLATGLRSRDRIPAHYADAVATVPEVVDWVRTLVQSTAAKKMTIPRIGAGPSLLLVGGTGSGKTYQAFGAIRALTASGASCSWLATTAADMYGALRPRHRVDSEEEFERYTRATVLVLDDLGAAKGTEWNEEINYRLINYRYENEKPTLITTNVPAKDIQTALGERVTSRLVEMTRRVVIKGPDRRIAVAATPLRATS